MISRTHNIAIALDAMDRLGELAAAKGDTDLADDIAVARRRVDHVWQNSVSRDDFVEQTPMELRITRAWLQTHETLLVWAKCAADNQLTADDLDRESALLNSALLSLPRRYLNAEPALA